MSDEPQNYSAIPLRLVLDTNVWLDWLVFDDPGVAAIKSAAAAGRAEILIGPACIQELERALTYSLQKKLLDTDAQAACLAECRRVARMADVISSRGDQAQVAHDLPVCRDPNDQKFLELARDCGADYLVTRDRALLDLARRKVHPAPFRIVTPQQFTDALDARSASAATAER